jgi:hypothetical protein
VCQIFSDEPYQRHDVAWHIPANETESPPSVGEHVIDDASDQWTILKVERQTLGTRYRCQTRKLAIHNDLTHRVDVQPHWFDWRRGVRAQVQPVVATAVEQRDQHTTGATHQVFFALPIELDHNTRIVHKAAVYRVVAVSKTDRIDVLMTADVVQENGG